MKKDVAIGRFSGYSLPMSSLTFPADSAEYEEYCAVMDAMANEAEAFTPDPEPENEYWSQAERGDDGGLDGHLDSMYECEFEPEDRYLDSSWEDFNEYGMDGCCGDF
jgi:hypothetical protein